MKYLCTLIVVLGLLFAGCTSAPIETQSQTTTDAQAQPAASDSSASTAQATAPSASSPTTATSPIAKELEKILEKQFNIEYGVVYSFTALGPDAGPPSVIANYVVGLKKMRFDTIMEDYETRSYMSDEAFTTCNKFDGEWVCSTSKASDSDVNYEETSSPTETTQDIQENLDAYTIEKLPDKMIVNVKTSCYKITMTAGVTEYCYSPEAVPLYVKSTSTDDDGKTYTTIMEATSYMKSVPDSYFELPAGHVQTENQQNQEMSQEEIDALMAQYATE